MGRRPLYTIGGIPVRVQIWFFLVIGTLGVLMFPPAVYGSTYLVTWLAIATVSILVHEYGHAIAMRVYGLRPSITLHGMGGLTSASASSGDAVFTPTRSIVTSLAGPLSALVLLGLPAWAVATSHGLDPWYVFTPRRYLLDSPETIILGQIIYVNIGWSILNLIPVLPLDGGNVMASLGELVSPRGGRRSANLLSIVVAVVGGLWGLSAGVISAPVFAVVFIGLNLAELSRGRNDDTDRELAAAARALIAYDPMRAEQLAWSVLTQSPGGERFRWATELTAWARLARGDVHGARAAVASMAPQAGPSGSLLGAVALAAGNTAEGVHTLAWAFVNDDHKPAKVLGAMAAAQSGQVLTITELLLQMRPQGIEATRLFESLLEYAGHAEDARQVAGLLATRVP